MLPKKGNTTMKKLLVVLLAVMCVLSLVSCGSKDMKTMTTEFQNAEGTSATATITMIVAEGEEEDDEGQVITTTSKLFEKTDADEGKVNFLLVQVFAPLGFDDYGNAIIPDSDTTNLEGERSDVERISFSSLTFKTKFFASYTLTTNKFTAVVDKPDEFFGMDIPADEVDFEVRRGPYGPREIEISYETESGYQIEITIEYKYED